MKNSIVRAKRSQTAMTRKAPWWLLTLATSLMLLLSACGTPTAKGQSAQQEKARLDAQIEHALAIGVPDKLLAPIRRQEQQITDSLSAVTIFGDYNSDSDYANAITSYQVLESQVTAVIAQATNQAQFQANQDIQTFNQLLQQRQNQGADISGYQQRLAQAEQRYANATTPNDFYKVSAFANQQTEALQLLWPTHLQLQSLQNTIQMMAKAHLDTALGKQEYEADLATFKAASQPEDYKKLLALIDAQLNQLAANQVAAIPFVGAAMLEQYQQVIDQIKTYGEDVTQYQQQLEQDRQDLQNAHTVQAYLELSARIRSQMDTAQHNAIRGQTRYHLEQLGALIGQTDINNDYEYRDADDAYLQLKDRFDSAQTLDDYQQIDTQAQILLNNLQALLDNLKDPNYNHHDQPHATDLRLLQTYNLTTGKVIVVSLTEQTLRMYQDGKLVNWMYVVTGQRAAQTPPGLWHVYYKATNLTFKSSEPEGAALWYPPTHINYALEYHKGGYFLHDATWRRYFGPGANLPHDDYTSGSFSNNGSHGCINMNLDNAEVLYNWTDIGTPLIVY